ncbi:MAG: hypothetical protein KUG83_07535 [Gammaproteobacteria bacterium]|nr:hypothetical protein [Gammaproteobacteria bacterium]
MNVLVKIALLIALLPAVSYGGNKPAHENHAITSGVGLLSPGLRGLLVQEMQSLQDGMVSIIPAYHSGNWEEIEITARKMKNSYILKQELTKNQATELHSVLPHEFIKKDQQFHYLAGMLEHAAKSKKSELINFYFSEMNASCVGCHATFAIHRFPALAPKPKMKNHQDHH